MSLITPLLSATLDPFDPKLILMPKHAQHVVLIHFPIALFLTAVVFDFIAQNTRRQPLANAAYYNFLLAAVSLVPVLVTGVLAWQIQFPGQEIKGLLLLHLAFACFASLMILLTCLLHVRMRARRGPLPPYRFAIESIAVAAIVLTAHLGGFLSGVNHPG